MYGKWWDGPWNRCMTGSSMAVMKEELLGVIITWIGVDEKVCVDLK